MVDLSVVVSFRRLCAAYLLIRRRDGGRQRVYRLRRGDRRLAMAGATDASTSASRSPRCCARFSTTSQPSFSTATPTTRWRTPTSHRSEEHTSELQSLMRISYAVFCLQKKKQHNNHKKHR